MLLGVDIDHVATLRQARGTTYPSPLEAARAAEDAGADYITLHLREDRRHIQDRDVIALRKALRAPASVLTQDLYVSGALAQTGRVMVKDEDVCLHCGLCAERCPTGAWDMQKFLLDMARADDRCRARHTPAERPRAAVGEPGPVAAD